MRSWSGSWIFKRITRITQWLFFNHNDYPDKIEIKKELLSEYQLKIAGLHNILIGNIKKISIYLFFLIKKVCAPLWELATLFETRIRIKKIHCVLEFNQS